MHTLKQLSSHLALTRWFFLGGKVDRCLLVTANTHIERSFSVGEFEDKIGFFPANRTIAYVEEPGTLNNSTLCKMIYLFLFL